MRYCLFLLLAVVFCCSLAVTETVEATSSKKEAVALLQDLQQNTVGDKWVDYNNAINLLEQGGSRKELQIACNALMVKEENGDTLEKVSDVYFELNLNPKPKVGGSYWTITGFVFDPNRNKVKGTVYWWNYLRTILLVRSFATASGGYTVELWSRQYDCRASMTTASGNVLYSPWKNDLLPPPVVNFYCQY